MNIMISERNDLEIRVVADNKFGELLIKWLTPYVKKEVKKAIVEYEAVTYREAFDQVLCKEHSERQEKFHIYSELIDLNSEWDKAGINI